MTIGQVGVTRGLFAPAISHHGGRFYIVNTCIDCGGNFIVTADDPAGPWSDPVWLDFGGIDPSLFVDDDGTAWIAYNDAPPGPPEYDGHRAMWIQRIDLAAMKMAPTRTLLVDEGVHPADKPVWAEGPHIYKVGDLLPDRRRRRHRRPAQPDHLPRRQGHRPLRARPDQPDPDPARPARRPRVPVQATGHADFVQIADGSWWAVFLATRPYRGSADQSGARDLPAAGQWKDGWPVILPPGAAVPPTARRPDLPAGPGDSLDSWRDEFDDSRLALDWMMLRTPQGSQLVEPVGPARRAATDRTARRGGIARASRASSAKDCDIMTP